MTYIAFEKPAEIICFWGPGHQKSLWGVLVTSRFFHVAWGWEYGSPDTLSYGPLASKIAELSGAVVMMPDFPLAPVGDYHVTRLF